MTRLLALALGAATLATPAFAQTAPAQTAPTAGATVFDTKGGEVGRIESVANGAAVVDTGTNKVTMPVTSFAAGEKGPVIAMTKIELDAAAGKAKADAATTLQSQLTAGTQVHSQDGASMIGTIKAADASFVTLTTPKGEVKLPANAFGANGGKIVIGMTAADFDAAVTQATAAAAPAAATEAVPAETGATTGTPQQ